MSRTISVAAWTAVVIFGSVELSRADGPQDNSIDHVRPIPPPGIELTQEQTAALQQRIETLHQRLELLRSQDGDTATRLLPDVEVLVRAVEQAVNHQEMYQPNDIQNAHKLLDMAEERAAHLEQGRAPWTRQHGLVVRGFRSTLDDTVQPYGLEIADDYHFDHPLPARCDLWFHGRGERTLELQFLAQRANRPGQYPPTSGIVLHPYGRYSNAFKFAGEVDTLEALAEVQRQYRIDEDRISVRGFSMGGAACWQFAVHYTDRWFAANPGAGFSETPQFLKSFQGEALDPPWYEEKLWRMYDCDKWAANLHQLPTVAYSGDLDRQKQAADVMEARLKDHGIQLMHIIGPETGHKIHPDSNRLIRAKFDHLARRGLDRQPRSLRFVTFTLKYNRMHWLTVHRLKEHWERSTVDADVIGDDSLNLNVEGVTEFTIDFPAGTSPFALQSNVSITINGQTMPLEKTRSDLSFSVRYHHDGIRWQAGPAPQVAHLQKRHNLQGPIDDALMSSFLFVRPTGEYELPQLRQWVDQEMQRAIREWRRQMRGDVRIKKDQDVTEQDIANHNLILWGTPATNSVMYKVAGALPVRWADQNIHVGEKQYSDDSHVAVLVSPNPLNPQRYVVYNSGLTYREYDYLNNARQTPKLPDWAIIDITTPPNSRWPGKVVDADFFDEQWQLKQ